MKIVCLTSTITEKTKLLILDEPAWGIDLYGQKLLFDMLNEISEKLNLALLIISHDLSLVRALSAKILWVNRGELFYFENIDNFFSYEEALDHY
jgi:ABC-type dipeptide/oligopeptide/nickel transport system ATPase subunit